MRGMESFSRKSWVIPLLLSSLLSISTPTIAHAVTVCDNYAVGGSGASLSTIGSGTIDCLLTFTSSGTWTVPSDAANTARTLVVGGGGGGGANVGFGGGGGASAAGTFDTTIGNSLTITVGSGGRGGYLTTANAFRVLDTNLIGGNGGASSLIGTGLNVTAGGGYGGNTFWTNTNCDGSGYPGTTGTSGGSVSANTGLTSYTSSLGGAGGYPRNNNTGTQGYSQTTTFQITGSNLYYGDGGGASGFGTLAGGAGGSGGGGAGSSTNSTSGFAATFYGGGGGGGNASCSSGGAGYGGVVIIRYTPTPRIAVTSNPGSTSIAAGSSTTLNCASTGIGSSTYQWYSSTNGSTWNALAGATSSSYSTGNLAYTSSGIQYKVVITNSYNGLSATATSSAATITVTQNQTTASMTIAGNPATLQFNKSIVITATLSSGEGYVTFYANRRLIPKCKSKLTSSGIATCSFKPYIHGNMELSVSSSPVNSNYTAASYSQRIPVVTRSSSRA